MTRIRPIALDLPGPSRRITVEPIQLPQPAREPAPAPEREPVPPDPGKRPDREPIPA